MWMKAGTNLDLPPSRLIDTLGDKICRKHGRKIFSMFEREVDLGIRHGARFKPAIEHFGHSSQRRFGRIHRRNHQVIDTAKSSKIIKKTSISEQKNKKIINPVPHFSRCKSVMVTPVNFDSSSMLDTHTTSSPSSDVHRGIGVPQYRFRLTAQSRASFNQLPNLLSFTKSGTLKISYDKIMKDLELLKMKFVAPLRKRT